MIGSGNKSNKYLRFNYVPRYHNEKKEELEIRKSEIKRQVEAGSEVQTTKRRTFELVNRVEKRKMSSLVKPIAIGAVVLLTLYALELMIVYLAKQ